MTYLFLGDDRSAKDKRIAELRNKTLKSQESLKFDYEILHSHKLNPDTFKKALISIPAIGDKRFVLIRQCHKLSPHNKKILLTYLKNSSDKIIIVLDSDELAPQDSLMKALNPYVKVVGFYREVKQNVFDMTRAIGMQRPQEALKILSNLMSSGEHPLKIMGGLIWFWGKSRGRISANRFKKGLLVLQEADFNIKRSRLKPEYAMELLVVKLCSLN